MDKKLVVVDVDDVLIDLNKSVESMINSLGYREFKVENILTYSLNKDIDASMLPENQRGLEDNGLGCPRGLILDLYSNLFSIANANFAPNIDEGLTLLSESFNVMIYTSSWSFEIARYKLNLFEEYFSKLDLSYTFCIGKNKPALKGVHAVFEDCIDNLHEYSDDCVKILVDRPQNCELFNKESLCQLKNLYRAKNFYDGVEYLLKER